MYINRQYCYVTVIRILNLIFKSYLKTLVKYSGICGICNRELSLLGVIISLGLYVTYAKRNCESIYAFERSPFFVDA